MIELPADVRALFDAPNYAHLTTVLHGGGPHSVPVWAGIEDGKIAFLTSQGSRKARNLAADPRVAISVTDCGNPYAMAQVRGRVTARLDGKQTAPEQAAPHPSAVADFAIGRQHVFGDLSGARQSGARLG